MPPRPAAAAGSSSSATLKKEEEVLDNPLHVFDFKYEDVSGKKVSGHLQVTPRCCQPFKVLHGGVTALVSESLASMGACLACGLKRVAGIHVSINHFKSAQLGDLVYAEATPLSIGKTIQVWEARFWKTMSSKNPEEKTLISSSRVTLVCNMPLPETDTDPLKAFRKYAKL